MANQHCSHHHYYLHLDRFALNVGRLCSLNQAKTVISFVFAFIFILCLGLGPIQAQTTATASAIVLSPTFIEIELKETDQQQTAQLIVENRTSLAQEFEITAITVNQIDNQGNPVLFDRPAAISPNQLAANISFDRPEFSLAAGQQQELTLTVDNSQDLSPGGNYAIVLLRSKVEDEISAGNQRIYPAVSTFVLIRKLGGESYNLSLSEIDAGSSRFWLQVPKSLTLTFSNQGNIHIVPRGEVRLTDIFGRVVYEGTINDSSMFVFPRTQRTISITLRQIRPSWPLMLYTLSVDGRSEPGEVAFSLQLFWFLVDRLVLIIALISISVATALVLLRKRLKVAK